MYTVPVDAAPLLIEVGRLLQKLNLEAVLIGNAAAALQRAPVTTVDLDFSFRKTPANLRKLKALASALGAIVLRPYYPASDMYRVVREADGLQLDFMATIHGIRSFEGLRSRAHTVEINGVPIRAASLSDIIKSKRAARGPGISPCSKCWRGHVKKPTVRRRKLDAVARESERALRDMIRRWQALPPGRRTHFLRKRIGGGRSVL